LNSLFFLTLANELDVSEIVNKFKVRKIELSESEEKVLREKIPLISDNLDNL